MWFNELAQIVVKGSIFNQKNKEYNTPKYNINY